MSLPGSKQHILIPRRHRTVFFKPEVKETTKMKHAKALNPFQLLLKPISQKCLDLVLSTSSSDSDSDAENNKSCHCRDCGHQSKKMKHMKRKFRHFSPVMHAVIRERRKKLKQKFRNAVYVIMWMQRLAVQRKKKKMLVRKIVRMKTKVLDILPEPQPIEQQIIYIEPTQPVQVQMIDFKHKQRQSIVNYLHNKLHDHEIHTNNYQLSLPKLKQQSILSQSHSKLTKTLRTQGDEVETPLRTNLHSLVNKASPPKQSTISPYLKQPQLTLRVFACSEQSMHKQLQSHRSNQKSRSQDIFGRNKFHQRKLTSSNTPF